MSAMRWDWLFLRGHKGMIRGVRLTDMGSLKRRGTEDAEVRILSGDDGVPCGWIEVVFDEEWGGVQSTP